MRQRGARCRGVARRVPWCGGVARRVPWCGGLARGAVVRWRGASCRGAVVGGAARHCRCDSDSSGCEPDSVRALMASKCSSIRRLKGRASPRTWFRPCCASQGGPMRGPHSAVRRPQPSVRGPQPSMRGPQSAMRGPQAGGTHLQLTYRGASGSSGHAARGLRAVEAECMRRRLKTCAMREGVP